MTLSARVPLFDTICHTLTLLCVGTIFLYGVVLYNGLSKASAPGSLHVAAPGDLFPPSLLQVPSTFGIVMFSFAGHSVIPNLYLDMRERRRFGRSLNVAYVLVLAFFLFLGVCGYFMFGRLTDKEVRPMSMMLCAVQDVVCRLVCCMILC